MNEALVVGGAVLLFVLAFGFAYALCVVAKRADEDNGHG